MCLNDKNSKPKRTKKDKAVDRSTGNRETTDDRDADTEKHRASMELETRRKQNRDAAARHRQRQQLRLAELGKREAVLSQQVAELEQELDGLQKSRCGLAAPDKDPFTASMLEMIEEVNDLRASLMLYAAQSENLISELRQLAERLVICNAQDTRDAQDTVISSGTEAVEKNQQETADDRR